MIPVPRLLNPPLHWRKVVAGPSRLPGRLSTPSTCATRCNASLLSPFSVFQSHSEKLPREDNGDRHLVTRSAAWRICMKITVTRSSFLPADATSCRNKKKRKKERKKEKKTSSASVATRRAGKLFMNFNFNAWSDYSFRHPRVTPNNSEIVF